MQAPDIVSKANTFLNRDGGDFVAALYEATGSWLSVDQAYSNPPVSTEQILHPEKYLAGELPEPPPTLPDFAAGLNSAEPSRRGWNEVSRGTLGEFFIRAYLEEELNRAQAAAAAAGWGGDAYYLATGPENTRMLMAQITWDTEADSAEFFEAYKTFGNIKANEAGTAPQSVFDGAGWVWTLQDSVIFLGQSGQSSLLIVAKDTAIISAVLGILNSFLQEGLTP
ncbi:MAG: hypothetical protein FJ317_03780 [SAR202 cluster bacterium]|nr:hypothetical protein [SAR202 cluster bacterium]